MIPTSQINALKNASRINVVGTSGSGKTTFGREIGKIKNIPFIEMDSLFWQPNWQESSEEEFLPKVRTVVSQDAWVLDGNYHSRTISIKWPRTQVVIFIDLPFVQTIYRVTRRALIRSLTRTELWPGTGNRESLRRNFFSRDSVIWWAITHHKQNRDRYLNPDLQQNYPHIAFIHLDSKAKVEYCLASLGNAHDSLDSRHAGASARPR